MCIAPCLCAGVTVKILTNNFGKDCASGQLDMLEFLRLNDAHIR